MSHCRKSMNSLEISIFALLHNFNFYALQWLLVFWTQIDWNTMVSICVVTSTSSQRILARNGTVVAPVDQDILKMEGTSALSLELYLWRQHSSANLSPKQRSGRVLSSEPLAGAASAAKGSSTADKEAAFGEPCSCRHNNTLISSWPSVSCCCNECTAFECAARPQGAGGPAGCRRAGRAQAGTKRLHIVCAQT
jgi:hypothetical protein